MSLPGGADPAGGAVRAVAAHGLAGSHLALPEGPLADDVWPEFFRAARRQRLIGLLAATVADGALEVTDAQHEQVATAHAVAMKRVLDIEVLALDVVERLEQAGVGVRVLKGLATAHVDMADPARRDFGDVDLLVEPGRFALAVATLTAAGMPRDLPERRPGFDERFAKEATLYGPREVEIDLHRLLALGAFGLRLDPRSVWDDGQPFVVGGRRLCALQPPARLLHAAYSSLLGDRSPRLVSLRDTAQLAQRDDIDGDAVVALARVAGGQAVLARALRLAGDTFGTGPDWALWRWAGAHRGGWWDRTCLRAYESQGGSNTTTLLSGALGLTTWRDRAAYAGAMAFPGRAYVAARRTAGRPSEWRRGLAELARSAVRTGRRAPG